MFKFFAIVLLFLLLIFMPQLIMGAKKPTTDKISPELHQKFSEQKTHTVIISCDSTNYKSDPGSDYFENEQYEDEEEGENDSEKDEADRISSTAFEKTVKPILKLLSKESFYVLPALNQIIVYDAGYALVQKIATKKPTKAIIPDIILSNTVPKKPKKQTLTPPSTKEPPSNEEIIQSRCAEDIVCEGENALVLIIDAGVMYNHIELKDNWIRHYGWFDAIDLDQPTNVPTDTLGFGTAVASVAVGKTLGVCKKCEWMACKACKGTPQKRECPLSALLICFEFALKPWAWNNRDDKGPRTPNVVIFTGEYKNGGGQLLDPSQDFLYDPVQKLNNAGIISVFSVGETGPNCNGPTIPGSQWNSLAVGGVEVTVGGVEETGYKATVLSVSSRGPVIAAQPLKGDIETNRQCIYQASDNLEKCSGAQAGDDVCVFTKPDLVATANNIKHADIGPPDSYAYWTGNEVAVGQVAGTVGLMICANKGPKLDYRSAYYYLTRNADTSKINLQGDENLYYAASSHLLCDVVISNNCNQFPNNEYGYGMLHVCDTVQAVKRGDYYNNKLQSLTHLANYSRAD